MKAHAARRGYRLDSISRPVAPEDFDRFDRIVGMDDRNLRELRRLGRKTESGAAICKMKSPTRTTGATRDSSWYWT